MGFFIGGSRIKKDKEPEVKHLLDKYGFSDGLKCEVENGSIFIYGADWPLVWVSPQSNVEDDVFEKFLAELAPLLAENIMRRAIGNETCENPIDDAKILATQTGMVRRKGFQCPRCSCPSIKNE